MNVDRATPRLEMYNVHDFIALTPEVKGQLDKHPRWERTFSQQNYNIYHLKDGDPHYVRVPRFEPVLLETDKKSWKKEFPPLVPQRRGHRHPDRGGMERSGDGALAPPAAERVTDRAAPRAGSGCADCKIDEQVDHFAIDFTTTCPGLPHTISVAYYPNWKVEGASRVFLVSPALMLVYPDGPHIRLTYRRITADWIGLGLSLLGLAICAAGRQRVALAEVTGPVARGLTTAQPASLVYLGTLVVFAFTTWHVLQQYAPQVIYKRGWQAFSKNDYPTSLKLFERAMIFGGETYTAQEAVFFRAASLYRMQKLDEAREAYEYMIRPLPGQHPRPREQLPRRTHPAAAGSASGGGAALPVRHRHVAREPLGHDIGGAARADAEGAGAAWARRRRPTPADARGRYAGRVSPPRCAIFQPSRAAIPRPARSRPYAASAHCGRRTNPPRPRRRHSARPPPGAPRRRRTRP